MNAPVMQSGGISMRSKASFTRAFTDRSVLEMTAERIKKTYDLFDHVAVSFSGGKDSTVCLNMTLDEARARRRLPLDVIFFDEEAVPYETEAYVRRVAALPDVAMRWYCLPVRHRNACSRTEPYWFPWAPEDQDLWVRPLPPEGVQFLEGFPGESVDTRISIPQSCGLLFHPRVHGTVGMIMGIRAQESMTRMLGVLKKQADNYMAPDTSPTSRGNLTKVKVIYDWQTSDVWRAPKILGWDYNEAYRIMDMGGVAPVDQRCAPPFGEEPLANLWMFSECFPALWDRMCARVPGAAAAARYSNSILYSHKTRLEKPDHLTWEEYLALLLERHEEKAKVAIAARLADEIKRHYSKTSDPILETAAHPMTGLSWRWMAMIASRGDLKKRKMAVKEAIKNPPAVMLAQYRAALADYRARAALASDEDLGG
jgi:predicted phosphoadenosine phosphosulfate sulfurtransferase